MTPTLTLMTWPSCWIRRNGGSGILPPMRSHSHELAGFLEVKLTGRVAEIGLGLRPDLTGHGAG